MNFFPQITSQAQTQVRASSLSWVGQSIQGWLVKLGQQTISWLTQGSEPRINQSIHADGTLTWHVYDPYSGQSTICHSVTEVREWLEARYSFHGPY